MHAAGAIATKLVPFLVIPYALAIGTETWAVLLLFALGVVQILFDAVYSVRASDWKKFRREMRLAR
jgi:NADH:ubiquinone oxidoreductase subunit 4 (subunit M)